jgi:hypothetical protein
VKSSDVTHHHFYCWACSIAELTAEHCEVQDRAECVQDFFHVPQPTHHSLTNLLIAMDVTYTATIRFQRLKLSLSNLHLMAMMYSLRFALLSLVLLQPFEAVELVNKADQVVNVLLPPNRPVQYRAQPVSMRLWRGGQPIVVDIGTDQLLEPTLLATCANSQVITILWCSPFCTPLYQLYEALMWIIVVLVLLSSLLWMMPNAWAR